MSTLNDLIEIYSRHTSQDVANDPAFKDLCDANDSDKIFHSQRLRVENIKKNLDEQVDIHDSYQSEVKFALKLFERLVGSPNGEEEICRELTRKSFYPKWSDEQKDYYDKTSDLIVSQSDYFLSFTQRNQGGAGNPINRYHRHLIQSAGLPDPKDSKKNELAKVLDLLLRTSRYQFRGFFYPEREDDSTGVDPKLTDNMTQAIVFVQLVQNEMFSKFYLGKRNHCHEEFCQAIKEEKKSIFLFADGTHPDDLIPEVEADYGLDPWYKFVERIDCVSMPSTEFAEDSANIPAGRDNLKKNLVEKLQLLLEERLYKHVPTDQ